jgi:hypothetical protein
VLTRTIIVAVLTLLAGGARAEASQSISSAQRPSSSDSPSSLRWYEAYDEGVAAVRRGDWKRAEAMLLSAKQRHPEQGTEVFYYGQTYRPFVPDYYLAQVYLGTGRSAEALTTLGAVKKAGLADEKDPAFRDVLGRAQDAVVAQARREATNDRRAEVQRLVSALRAVGADPGLIGEFQPYLDGASNAPEVKPPLVASANPNAQNAQTMAGGRVGDYASGFGLPGGIDSNRPTFPNAATGTGGSASSSTGNTASVPGARGNRLAGGRTTRSTPADAPAAALDWSGGLRAFLAGDYPTASSLLAGGADSSAPPRVQLYLACARVGQVLVGAGDTALLRSARETFRSAGLAAAIGPDDRNYISPRILAQLEAR